MSMMSARSQDITQAALAHRYTQASFRTLDKHAAIGPIDTVAALRLLRRNVRDVAPAASYDTQQQIARDLLDIWRHGA